MGVFDTAKYACVPDPDRVFELNILGGPDLQIFPELGALDAFQDPYSGKAVEVSRLHDPSNLESNPYLQLAPVRDLPRILDLLYEVLGAIKKDRSGLVDNPIETQTASGLIIQERERRECTAGHQESQASTRFHYIHFVFAPALTENQAVAVA